MLAHFNHLGELALFLIQAGILLLFFAQLGCGIEQKLEVLGVTPALEQIDLGQQLLLLLL